MPEDLELASDVRFLLKPSRRLILGSRLRRYGKDLEREWTHHPQLLSWNWPAIIAWIGGALGGMALTDAYVLAKAAVMAKLKRGAGAIATKDEAHAVASWALKRRYRIGHDELTLQQSDISDEGAWIFTMVNATHSFRVQLPTGELDVDKVFIQRRPLIPWMPRLPVAFDWS